MGLQDDRMSGNIQDIARLITRLLLKGDMPQYTLPAAEADYTEADHLFKKVIGLADEGDINGAENELLMNMVYFLSYSSGSARVTRCPSAQVTT
mgnify:CR=1 FL=1